MLMTADVRLNLPLLKQGSDGQKLIQAFSVSVLATTDPEQRQVTHHQSQPCLPGRRTGQLLPRPLQLNIRNAMGTGVPDDPEHGILQNGVVEREMSLIAEIQS